MFELNKEVFEQFKEAGKAMVSYGYPVGEKARLFLEYGKYVYATNEGCDLGNLNEGDIGILRDEMLPLYDTKMVAMVYSQTPNLMKALKLGRGFQASLDDMAQIIGNMFCVADCRYEDPFYQPDIAKFTKKYSACAVITDYDKEKNEYDGFYLTSGRDLKEAVTGMEILEKSATVQFLGDKINFPKAINGFDARIQRMVYLKKYSKSRICGFEHGTLGDVSEEELKLRKDIIDYSLKLEEKGLVQGTWGNLSIKLDDKYMLVTPSGIDYDELLPEDIVKVEISSLEWEGNLKPTSEKSLHAGIYLKRPDVKAIVHTHSTYCSAFAACETALPVKEEKNREKYSEQFECAAYGLPGTKTLAKATVAGLGNKLGVIMAHHGMVAVGSSIKDAFENAVFMENNAKEILENDINEKQEGNK